MREENWLQVRDLFDEVFDLNPAERLDYLNNHYAADAMRRVRLEQLLRWETASAHFLEAPVLTDLCDLFRPKAATGAHIGPYRIEREIGRGGMGVVYLAVRADDVFSKQVAIKLVWPGLRQTTERFRQERQILADLEHPHIARLLDGGATPEGWQYLVMEYVEGIMLTDYCQQHNLSVRARLDLFLDICAAVQHAHQRLIIHRDLKPSNILVTAEGQVKLLDFGIAKALDASAYASDLSLPGIHLMTPEYASPEQLTSAPVTTASDVYSLGVVLFELLTGQRPFQFPSRRPHEIAQILSQQEPPRLSQTSKAKSSKSLRGDLENMVWRALQPLPHDRYASVEQFSEDLRRHLNGEVVQARKPTFTYRFGRFVRRHKAAFSAAAIVIAVLCLWLAVFLRQVRQERMQAQAQRRQLYAAEMKQALSDWKNNDLMQMQQTLARWQAPKGEEDLRGFEWGYLQRLLNASSLTIPLPAKPVNVAYFPAENAVAVGLEDQRVLVFDSTTGQTIRAFPGHDAQWAGHSIITATKELFRMYEQRQIVTFDLFSGTLKQAYNLPQGRIQAFVYYHGAPARYAIAEESGAVSIVDVTTNTELFRLPGQGKPVSFFNFSVPHNLLVTVTGERTIRLDDISRQQTPRIFTEPTNIRFVEITADGQTLLLQNQNELHLRDVRTGRVLQSYPDHANTISTHTLGHNNEVIAISKQDCTIEICDFPSFRKLRTLSGHTRPATWLGFTSDNQFLLSTAMDRTVRLWDWRTGQEKAVLCGHTGDITTQDFVNGKFVTASQDRTLRVWDFAEVTKPTVLRGATNHILTIAFSPDNQHVAAGGKDNTAIIHDSLTGAQKVLRGHQKFVYVTRFSPDGRWLITGSDDGTAKVWDAATGNELQRFLKGSREYYDGVRSLAFLADQRLIAFGGNDGTITLWDAINNRVLRQFSAHAREVLSVSLSPNGKLLATASWDNTAKLWDTATWQERAVITGHQGHVWSAVFSPDGKQLATGSEDQTIKLWDVATLELQHTLIGHNDGIFQIAYTPDSKRLASVSDDQTVKIWNPRTGQELLTLREHTNEVWGVAFSPDGKTMLTGSWDQTLRLWRAVHW